MESAASITRVSVILNGPSDWRLWIATIRTTAKEHDIWQYIDPEQEETDTLAEPQYPSIQQVNDNATSYSKLTEDEKAHYQRLVKEYDRRITKYDRRQKGLAAIMAEIQRTISKSYEYILETDTVACVEEATCTHLSMTGRRVDHSLQKPAENPHHLRHRRLASELRKRLYTMQETGYSRGAQV
jgi:hypothetical protein